MNFIEAIKILHEETGIPNGFPPHCSTRAKELIALFADHLHNIAIYASLPNREIEYFARFCLAVVDTPADLTGALYIIPAVRYLCQQAIPIVGIDVETASLIDDLLSQWKIFLRRQPPNEIERMLKKPKVQNASFFRIHYDALKSNADGKSLNPIYASYGYQIHLSVRKMLECLSRDKDSALMETYELTARYFLKNVHPDVYTFALLPLKPDDSIIGLFELQLAKYLTSRYAVACSKDRPAEHVRYLRRLLAQKNIISHPHTSNAVPSSNQSRLAALAIDGDVHVQQPNTDADLDSELIGGGEIDDEYGPEAEPDIEVFKTKHSSNITVPHKPSLHQGQADNLTMSAFQHPFESRHLNLFHYSLLRQRRDALWGTDPRIDAIIGLVELLTHTGIPDDKLISLRKSPTKDQISLGVYCGNYYIIIPSVVIKKKEEVFNGCTPASSSVLVPVPPPISERLALICRHDSDYVFSAPESQKSRKLQPITSMEVMERYLHPLNDSNPYNTRIHLRAIASSFLPLYHSCYGLDPLICILISGEDRHRMFRSQMHYAFIPHVEFAEKYLKTHEAVDRAIHLNLQESIMRGFLQPLTGPSLRESLSKTERTS